MPRDDIEAVNWYRKAAEQNLPLAQDNLGTMCLAGRGVPADQVQAVAWLEKAAAQGHEQSKAKLAALEQVDGQQQLRTALVEGLIAVVVVGMALIVYKAARERAPTAALECA